MEVSINDVKPDTSTFDDFAHLRNYAEVIENTNALSAFKLLIDSNHHHYLFNHVFGGKGLVPATMIMELFIESATWFSKNYADNITNGLVVEKLLNLNIERSIALTLGDKLEVKVLLNEIEKEDSFVKMKLAIKSGRVQSSGKVIGERINATCEVVFSEQYSETAGLKLSKNDFIYYSFKPEVYYPYYFPALGPKFQSGTGKFAVSKDRNVLIGEYDCNEREADFIKDQKSKFIISPLGYDSCLQYTVFLSRIQSITGRLPTGCASLSIHKKHPTHGLCHIVSQCLYIDPVIMRSNFWSYDENWEMILSSENFVVTKDPYHNYSNRTAFENLLNENKTDDLNWLE